MSRTKTSCSCDTDVPDSPLRSRKRRLGPGIYLLRNAGKTTPLIAVIVMAVLLITGIVALMNSIPLSIKTIYGYSREYLGLTPRSNPDMSPRLREILETEAPVPLERIMLCRATDAEVRSIVGPWPFVVLALDPDDMNFYLDRMGAPTVDGRLPEPGAAEALISEPVARNLGLTHGDNLLSPDQSQAFSRNPVQIVGIAQSDQWIMLIPLDYHREYHFPRIDIVLAFAENERDQRILDEWAVERFRGEQARVYAFTELERDTDSMFDILYRILNIVIGMLVVVITLMMGMLMNIYQSQRIQEFGLLQALGHPKGRIIRRVLAESSILVISGWAMGIGLSMALLNLVDRTMMHPRAFALDIFDRQAYLYTVPVPIAIFLVAVFTVVWRLSESDPVSVVERRLI